jgi:hypothetical protein
MYVSSGKLVAQYFVPNPEGHKRIRYKDGDGNNCCYLNIEWVKAYYLHISKKKVYSRDGQIEWLRTCQDRIGRLIKAIQNDKIGEFVHNEFLPIVEQCALEKLPVNDREEFVSFATEELYYNISRGTSIVFFEKYVKYVLFRFLNLKRKELKTVEFNEAYRNHNMEEY